MIKISVWKRALFQLLLPAATVIPCLAGSFTNDGGWIRGTITLYPGESVSWRGYTNDPPSFLKSVEGLWEPVRLGRGGVTNFTRDFNQTGRYAFFQEYLRDTNTPYGYPYQGLIHVVAPTDPKPPLLIRSPIEGEQFGGGYFIASASVYERPKEVVSVDYYNVGNWIGGSTNTAHLGYETELFLMPGRRTLTAVATYLDGTQLESPPVTFIVQPYGTAGIWDIRPSPDGVLFMAIYATPASSGQAQGWHLRGSTNLTSWQSVYIFYSGGFMIEPVFRGLPNRFYYLGYCPPSGAIPGKCW